MRKAQRSREVGRTEEGRRKRERGEMGKRRGGEREREGDWRKKPVTKWRTEEDAQHRGRKARGGGVFSRRLWTRKKTKRIKARALRASMK